MGLILWFPIIIFGFIIPLQRALSENDNKYFGLALPLISFSFSLFAIFNSITSSETVDINYSLLLESFITFNIPTLFLYMIHLYTYKSNNRKCFYNNSNNEKAKLEYENLIKAVETLEKVIKPGQENQDLEPNDMFYENIIQSFENCYDLSFKILMEYMIFSGYKVAPSPKNVIEKACQNSIINNEQVWLDMISDREISLNDYNQSYQNEVIITSIRIKNIYILEFQALIQNLKEWF